MGERVVIDPQRMTEPVEAVPLEYGRGGRVADGWRVAWATIRTTATDAWSRIRLTAEREWPRLRAALEDLSKQANALARDVSRTIVPRLGGWRQVMFALGLAFVLGGVGGVFGHPVWAVSMWVGGLLIGFSFRIPRWKD